MTETDIKKLAVRIETACRPGMLSESEYDKELLVDDRITINTRIDQLRRGRSPVKAGKFARREFITRLLAEFLEGRNSVHWDTTSTKIVVRYNNGDIREYDKLKNAEKCIVAMLEGSDGETEPLDIERVWNDGKLHSTIPFRVRHSVELFTDTIDEPAVKVAPDTEKLDAEEVQVPAKGSDGEPTLTIISD